MCHCLQDEMSRYERVGQLEPLRQRLDLIVFCFGQPNGEYALPLRLPNG